MCGFAGFVSFQKAGRDSVSELKAMGSGIAHRGPDDSGMLVESKYNLGISHKRLSILDLSRAGQQPMESACGRYVVAYNGEIYNYKALRNELVALGHVFNSDTDTEVLLCLIQEMGLSRALSKLVGMFAFVILDRKKECLHLVRDRIGEKPVYYGWQKKTFLFGSELKALRRHSQWEGIIDSAALGEMLELSYIPAPKTIFENVHKVEPGQVVTIFLHSKNHGQVKKEKWWSYEQYRLTQSQEFASLNHGDILKLWEDEFSTVIADTKISDVPLGAFLSGGIDSALVTAFLQEASNTPVRTFSIGFSDQDYDESHAAEQVATYLGTDHQSLIVSQQEVFDVLPALPQIYDEPFADSSQILAVLISQFARTRVSVALSGDGGDEMFAGYNRYKWAHVVGRLSSIRPKQVRRLGAMLASGFDKVIRHLQASPFRRGVPKEINLVQFARQIKKVSDAMQCDDMIHIYRALTREVGAMRLLENPPDELLEIGHERVSRISQENRLLPEQFNMEDIVGYLPDDILVKVDRASMASGLEVRAPFLDHRVVEFSAKLGWNQKMVGGETKKLLRESLKNRVPSEMIGGVKRGFALPLSRWLAGPLKEWAEDLLSPTALKNTNLRPSVVREMWGDHCYGRGDYSTVLWNILMYQAWHENYKTRS